MRNWSRSFGCRSETFGKVTASSRGTVLTAGSSSAKGTAVSLGTTGFNYQAIVVSLHAASASASYVVDICIGDPASTGFIICPDLRLPGLCTTSFGGPSYVLPLFVPSGSALYARCASSTNSATCAITTTGLSSGLQGRRGFSKMVSLYTPSSSKGASLATGGSANVLTAFTQLSAGVAYRLNALLLTLGGPTSVTDSVWLMKVAAGGCGAQYPVMEALIGEVSTSTVGITPYVHGPDPCDIAASTPLWFAAQTDGTSLTIDAALHGFVY